MAEFSSDEEKKCPAVPQESPYHLPPDFGLFLEPKSSLMYGELGITAPVSNVNNKGISDNPSMYLSDKTLMPALDVDSMINCEAHPNEEFSPFTRF